MHKCTVALVPCCNCAGFGFLNKCNFAPSHLCRHALLQLCTNPSAELRQSSAAYGRLSPNANLPPEMKEGEGRDLLRFSRPRTPLRQRGFYATNRESIFSAWSTRRYRRRPWTTAETAGSHWAGSRSSYQPTATPARSGRKTECDPAFCLIFSHIRKEIRDDRHRRGAGRTDVGYPIRQRPALFCHRSVRLRHRYPGGE